MSQVSYTAEGFRATFRQPSLTLAEIAWRWVVGGTALLLCFFAIIEYFATLPVSGGDRMLLRTRHPYLVMRAIAHIFRGNLIRIVLAGILAALLLTLLWIAVSSLGRIATVRALLECFRKPVTNSGSAQTLPAGAMLRLNFLRAASALAAVVAIFGAAIIAGFASPAADPAPGLVFVLFLFLAALVWMAWSGMNWLLSLAGLFAVRDRVGAFDSISAAVSFTRERAAAIFAVSAWSSLAHLGAFMAASTVVFMPLGMAGLLPWRLIVLSMFMITLGYFAVVDWLYMARLAGYVCIAETPETLLPTPIPPVPIPVAPPPPVQTTIDRDELALSDVPVRPTILT